MCVICCSAAGRRQPTAKELEAMYKHNPHGAGYMVARAGQVEIHKGFMLFDDFLYAVRSERFTENDPVVYHFRISTQAGVTPYMTQPFALTNNLRITKALDLLCPCGVAHNGIIPLTTDQNEKEFSDTALFIVKYLSEMIHNRSELLNTKVQRKIEDLIWWGKLALLNGRGDLVTIGKFTEHNGLLLSNTNHIITEPRKIYAYSCNF